MCVCEDLQLVNSLMEDAVMVTLGRLSERLMEPVSSAGLRAGLINWLCKRIAQIKQLRDSLRSYN